MARGTAPRIPFPEVPGLKTAPNNLSVDIKFPLCPSKIEPDIPEFYNGLNSILKKICLN